MLKEVSKALLVAALFFEREVLFLTNEMLFWLIETLFLFEGKEIIFSFLLKALLMLFWIFRIPDVVQPIEKGEEEEEKEDL